MKVYKTQQEIEKDIKDGELYVDGDVKFECSFVIDANIRVEGNINAGNINAYNINAGNINAGNINANNIDAYDINADNINADDIDAYNIKAGNINADDINANNINAGNINADNINAGNINADNISYWAVCFAYNSFKCKSVEGTRDNCKHFCLDGEIEYKDEDDDKIEEAIEMLKSKGYRIVKK